MEKLENVFLTASSAVDLEKEFEKLFQGVELTLFNMKLKYSAEPLKYKNLLLEPEGFAQTSRYRVEYNYASESIEKSTGVIFAYTYESRYATSTQPYVVGMILYENDYIWLSVATEFNLKLGLLLRWIFHYQMKMKGVECIKTKPSVKKLLRYYQELGYRKLNGELEIEISEEEKYYPARFSIINHDMMQFSTSKSYDHLTSYCFSKLQTNIRAIDSNKFNL